MSEITRATEPESLPMVMTAFDLACFLGVNRKSVYERCKKGELPFARLGTRYFFHRDAVLEWLRGRGSVSRSSRRRR
jgi:excisionase family DNA binding protein